MKSRISPTSGDPEASQGPDAPQYVNRFNPNLHRRGFREQHRPGIGHLLLAAAAAEVKNLRIVDHDAVEVLRDQIAPDTLDEIQILFPDPWPKTRHHKRRLIQPAFATLAASRLRAGGWLRLATDWAPYAEHMRLVLDDCALLARQEASAPSGSTVNRAATRFEKRGLRLGHEVADLAYRRRP